MMTTQRLALRYMVGAIDLPAVMEIEARCFNFPWTREKFISAQQGDCIGLVAELDGEIVGYVVYELRATSLRILNFAVDLYGQRQGVGRYMTRRLIGKLSLRRRRSITAAVRERNMPAIKFFAACGFRAEGVLRDFYPPGEDAYLMEFNLQSEGVTGD